MVRCEKWKLLLFLCMVSSSPLMVVAQTGPTESTYPLISFRGKPAPKLFLTFDRTSSFVGGKSASTNELKFGFEFRKKLRLGLGFGNLVSDVVEEKSVVSPGSLKDSLVNAALSLSFLSLNAEYIFYDSKRWQIAMPVGMGIGSSYFYYYEKSGTNTFKEKRIDEGGVLILTASGQATYRVIRWVGLSAGLGYRIAVVSNDKVDESINSPVYTFKIRIFLGEIYKSVFPRGISGKRNPPYSNEYWD